MHISVIRFQVNLQNVKKKLLDSWELSCFVASGTYPGLVSFRKHNSLFNSC